MSLRFFSTKADVCLCLAAKASKGKEPADDKGEKTTRKAKRKSMVPTHLATLLLLRPNRHVALQLHDTHDTHDTQEVPEEDAEAPQFTWRKIEKKMLAVRPPPPRSWVAALGGGDREGMLTIPLNGMM